MARARIRVDPDAHLMAYFLDAPAMTMTVAAAATASGRGEAYCAIHLKTAWQDGLLERVMREERLGYRLTEKGREYVYARVTFPEVTTDELEAPRDPLALPEVVEDKPAYEVVSWGSVFEVRSGFDPAGSTIVLSFFRDGELVGTEILGSAAADQRVCPVCGGRDHYYAHSPMRQPCTTCERVVELLPDRPLLPVASGA